MLPLFEPRCCFLFWGTEYASKQSKSRDKQQQHNQHRQTGCKQHTESDTNTHSDAHRTTATTTAKHAFRAWTFASYSLPLTLC
jgi:hypothetical protein